MAGSARQCPGLQSDLIPSPLHPVHEPSLHPVLFPLVNVHRAQILIWLPPRQHHRDNGEESMSDRHQGAFLPRRAAIRLYWAARYVLFVLEATWAIATRICRSQRRPFRVLPLKRFPPLSGFPGPMPAQEARCWALGKRLMSVPSAASRISAARWPTPGIVSRRTMASWSAVSHWSIAPLTRAMASSKYSSVRKCSVS